MLESYKDRQSGGILLWTKPHFHLLHVRVCGRDGGVSGLEMGEEGGAGGEG